MKTQSNIIGFRHLLTCDKCGATSAVYAPIEDHGRACRAAGKDWTGGPFFCYHCTGGRVTIAADVVIPVFRTPSLFDSIGG